MLSQKQKIIFISLIFITIWGILITTFINEIEKLTSIQQFILVTGIPYITPSILLAYILNEDQNLSIKKIIGSYLFFSAFDLILPPFTVSITGQINTTIILGKASIDYLLAEAWMQLNIQGILLFIFTYIISFIIMLIISIFLLKTRELKELIKL